MIGLSNIQNLLTTSSHCIYLFNPNSLSHPGTYTQFNDLRRSIIIKLSRLRFGHNLLPLPISVALDLLTHPTVPVTLNPFLAVT